MESLFLQILNMSVSAIWLILAVMVIRFFMQKVNAPKNLRYLLWLLVAIRLLCPFTFESALSLLPRQEVLPKELQVSKTEQVDTLFDVKVEKETVQKHIYGINNIVLNTDNANDVNNTNDTNDTNDTNEGTLTNNQMNHVTPQSKNTGTNQGENVGINWSLLLSVIWSIGAIAFMGYGILSYVNLRKKVSASVCTEDGVWICDEIHSPFLLGLRKPRIYMPSDIEKTRIPYIIAHENEHMKCLDHLWKPLGFFLLCMHWFNPFVWVAYILMCRDIEYACDERVVRTMDNVQKKLYSESLLLCSSSRHYITACPVAFGEISIKERIKNVVNYKKPAVWIVSIGIVACVVVAICFMTSPPKEETDPNKTNADGTVTNNEGNDKTVENNASYITENGIEGMPGTEENDDTTYIETVKNKVLFETTADLNHDGIQDLVQTVLIYNSKDKEDEITEDDIVNPAHSVAIKIHRGVSDGIYEIGPGTTSDIVSTTHALNGTYVLTEKDGKDYLIYSNMYQMMGDAHYSYEILYLKEEELVSYTKDEVYFICDPWSQDWETEPHREDVIPAFKEGLEEWINDTSIILVSFDVMEEPYYSAGDCLIPASMYYEKVWERNEDEALAEYDAVLGEEWQQYMYNHNGHNFDRIYWIQEQLESDFSEWYTEYDGSKLQRVVSADPDQAAHGPSVNMDIIYYQADANEDVQDVLYKMFEAMLVARMEPEEGRSYTITDYVVGDIPVVQISERMWLVKYLSGYYKYDGTDLVTYEEALDDYEEEHIIDGCIPIMMQGSDDNFWYLLIEEDGVYRLQSYGDMVNK